MPGIQRWGALLCTALFLSTLVPSRGTAQVRTASVSALGLADSYGVLARGYAATGANPALLGLDGNPFFSLAMDA